MNQSDFDPRAVAVDAAGELYRLIAETIPQIVWSARPDGSDEFHNGRASEYSGLDRSQLAGSGWQAIVHPEDLAACLEAWDKAVAAGQPFSFEYRLRRKDGAWRWYLSRALPLRDRRGQIVRWLGTATDIDDHKRAAERLEAQVRERTHALRGSEQRFRALTELSSDWYWEQDAELRFVGTAGRTALRAGITEGDHIGKRRWELPGTEILGQGWDEHRAALSARASFRDLMLKRTALDGSAYYVSVSGEPRYDPSGTFAGYHGVARDVTAHYRAAAALRETESRLRLTLDSVPAAIYFYDCDERIITANHGYAGIVEKRLDEIAGRTIREVAGEEAYALAQPYIRRALAGETTTYERRRTRKDGRTRDLRIQNVPHREESGRVSGACALIIDITDLKETQRALQSSEVRFRGLADLWADWYWEQDEELRFTYLSPDLERRANVESSVVLGKTRWELPAIGVTAEQWARHRADLEARRPFQGFEYQHVNAAGDLIWLSASGVPVFDEAGRFLGYHGIGRNITERKRAEAALIESEARFRSLTSLSSDFYWETGVDHRLRLLEYGARHRPLHPRQHMIGKARWEVESIAPDEEGWRKHRAILDAHMPFRDFEFSRSRQDGEIFHYAISGEPMFDTAGVFVGYRGVGRDVTERRRADRAQRENERRIRALLRRLTAAQEAERRRIAADLHDFVGQNLTALGIALETLRGRTPGAANASTFDEIEELRKDTMDSVRQTMSDLRPPLLDDYGLVSALESHARRFSARTGLAVSVQGHRFGARPAPNVELALFRIAQEALANALKHASATSARIALACQGGFLRLSIEDDGSGFAQPSGARAEHRGGWGLPMMRERAEEAGGTLRIEFPARGTRVVAEVPHVDSNHSG